MQGLIFSGLHSRGLTYGIVQYRLSQIPDLDQDQSLGKHMKSLLEIRYILEFMIELFRLDI